MNDLVAVKKKYIKPITESFPMILEDIITNSSNAENFNSQLDDGQDGWDNVEPDSIPVLDEDIDW